MLAIDAALGAPMVFLGGTDLLLQREFAVFAPREKMQDAGRPDNMRSEIFSLLKSHFHVTVATSAHCCRVAERGCTSKARPRVFPAPAPRAAELAYRRSHERARGNWEGGRSGGSDLRERERKEGESERSKTDGRET